LTAGRFLAARLSVRFFFGRITYLESTIAERARSDADASSNGGTTVLR
jgi:hypothetical protein